MDGWCGSNDRAEMVNNFIVSAIWNSNFNPTLRRALFPSPIPLSGINLVACRIMTTLGYGTDRDQSISSHLPGDDPLLLLLLLITLSSVPSERCELIFCGT